MNVQFVSTVAVIVANPEKSRELFVDALGLPLEGDDYPTVRASKASNTSASGRSPRPRKHVSALSFVSVALLTRVLSSAVRSNPHRG